MSEKDTFQILADEITLIRGEIKQLQRSSLNKDEAKALNQQLVQGVDSMAQTGQAVYEAISERMDLRLEKLAIETILAAKDAASGAIAKNHAETIAAARDLSKAAGEARREAWRYFGGFWVWLASVGAGGAVRASSANIHGSTAPRQAARFRNRRTAAASAPSGSSDRLKPGADLPAAPAYFMANSPLAIGASDGSSGAIRTKCPSVISVTYGVSYAPHNLLKKIMKNPLSVPKGSNFGSERVKLWFRKGQTTSLPI